MDLATLEWVSWYNHRRLLGSIGYVPLAEADSAYYQQHWQLIQKQQEEQTGKTISV